MTDTTPTLQKTGHSSRYDFQTYGQWLLHAPSGEMTADEKRHSQALHRWDLENPQAAARLGALVGQKVRLVGRHRAYDTRSTPPRDGASGTVLYRFADRLFVDFSSCGQLLVKAAWIKKISKL